MTSDQLRQLLSLAKQISHSPVLTEQLIGEIEGRAESSLLARIVNCLDHIHLKDLGITEATSDQYFVPSSITYTPLYESQELSICFFALSKGMGLPLHDHPEMAVITSVVKGRMKFKLADLVERESDQLYTYREKDIGEMTAPGVLALTPAMCNLHQFLAMEDTVMLDIFIPNYSQVRDITYFLEVSPTKVCGIKSALLNFSRVRYTGLSFEDSD